MIISSKIFYLNKKNDCKKQYKKYNFYIINQEYLMALNKIKNLVNKVSALNSKISSEKLLLPKPVAAFTVMFALSFMVIALETIQFHVLLVTSNYIQATFIIGVAMFGIALGGLISFYISKLPLPLILITSGICLFFSIITAYYNLIFPAAMDFPYLMIFPFIFASIGISSLFSHGHSTTLYFTNLVGSGLGVIFPIIFVPLLKSESSMILLLTIPVFTILVSSLRIKNLVLKPIFAVGSIILLVYIGLFIQTNRALPLEIEQTVYEQKILPDMGKPDIKKNYSTNPATELFSKKYKLNDGYYTLASDIDNYDRKRINYFLGVTGYRNRFKMPFYSLFEPNPVLKNIEKIEKSIYEDKIFPDLKAYFTYTHAGKNYDRAFLDRVYKLDKERKVYVLGGDDYDKRRASYLLAQTGHWFIVDLNYDIRHHDSLTERMKWYTWNNRLLLAEDSMMGRVDYTGDDDYMNMAMNGVYLDGIDYYNGAAIDPRVPQAPYMKNPEIFIVGLSADGIVKSAKRVPGAKVTGIEINPTILRTMNEGQFAEFAKMPYVGLEAHTGEGRSWLENSDRKFDMITLMNIHMEHGPVSTLSPENFHTIEGTNLLLDKLTDRGMVVYEEIVTGKRSRLAFKKFLNTVKATLRTRGIKEPEKCIYIFQWDFAAKGDIFRTLCIKSTPFTEKQAQQLDEFVDVVDKRKYYSGAKMFGSTKITYHPYKNLGTDYENFIRSEDQLSTTETSRYVTNSEYKHWFTDKLKGDDLKFIEDNFQATKWATYVMPYNKYKNKEIKDRYIKILKKVGYPIEIDLEPVSDNKPFPFNIYKNRYEAVDNIRKISLLSLFLIIPVLLMVVIRRKKYKMPPLLPVLFAAVTGFGYMLVEIVLLQKFQMFIGDANYTLIVILGGMLFFSGIGSFTSRYIPRKVLIVLTGLIPILLIFNILLLDKIFILFSGFSFAGKVISSAFLIMPLTYLIGIPFPTTMETMKKYSSPEFSSLLFGVSGGFSTLGSATAFLLNVSMGFAMTFWIGSACYAAGLALFVLIILKANKLGGIA
jgi:hypothetical protein